jgi:hypothetical protein
VDTLIRMAAAQDQPETRDITAPVATLLPDSADAHASPAMVRMTDTETVVRDRRGRTARLAHHHEVDRLVLHRVPGRFGGRARTLDLMREDDCLVPRADTAVGL